MRVTEVRVAFKKMLSDGQYGHEVFDVAYTAEVGPEESSLDVAAHLCGLARDVALHHLKASASDVVQQGAETRDEREARRERERAEREAARERWRLEAEREIDDDPADDDPEEELADVGRWPAITAAEEDGVGDAAEGRV
jgi:hypothetical protein